MEKSTKFTWTNMYMISFRDNPSHNHIKGITYLVLYKRNLRSFGIKRIIQ